MSKDSNEKSEHYARTDWYCKQNERDAGGSEGNATDQKHCNSNEELQLLLQ